VDFLNRQRTDTSGVPWFTVASLVNPHDVSSWPINWQVPPGVAGVVGWEGYPPPPSIPARGAKSRIDTCWTVINGDSVRRIFQVDLNPDGFPQSNSFLPPTYAESLADKPWCQQDYRMKWGLAFGANSDYNFIQQSQPFRSPLPFQLQGTNYAPWSLSYLQFYFYCQYLADLQLRKILQSLDSNGLTNNTIVVFLSDHGDMTAAHGGMLQKWHNAYEESVRVPMIISSPLINENSQEMREILQPTSSIDLAPTLLALAGFKPDELTDKLAAGHHASKGTTFPGADLSSHIWGTNTGPIVGPDGNWRYGVLFVSNDMITELGTVNPGDKKKGSFNLFCQRVDSTIALGYSMDTGTVRQPNNMRAFCTGDWKIVKYVDPHGVEQDQWELYSLAFDPLEQINLVHFRTGAVRDDVSVPGMTAEELRLKNESLRQQLANATGVAETASPAAQIQLFQNIPNPFSQQTTIPFFIPDSGPVLLTLSNLAGNEFLVIVNQELPAGNHKYNIDGKHIPSGIYLATLRFNSQTVVKKIIVIK
jgi:hypothetical protein